jgi:uncharacterized protein
MTCKNAEMISKTAMLPLVKQLRWKEVRDGLAENPDLLQIRDKRGRTWLHLACAVDVSERAAAVRDSIRLAEILLDRGLDINDAAFTEENFRATPLWYAIAFGKNIRLAELLLARGCDPNSCMYAAAYNDDAAAIRLLADHGAEIDPVAEGSTPLLAAVQWNRLKAIDELLTHGADPNYQDSKGMTAARTDIPNKSGLTAAAIMMKKRDPDFHGMLKSGPLAERKRAPL